MSSTQISKKVIEVADRYGSNNPQQLKQLLSKLKRLDPEEVFEGLFAVLCVGNDNDFQRQQLAGALLFFLQPRVNLDIAERIYMTLSSWNRSVEEWPWYLVDVFGKDSVIKATELVASRTLSARQQERLTTIRWWTNRYQSKSQKDA